MSLAGEVYQIADNLSPTSIVERGIIDEWFPPCFRGALRPLLALIAHYLSCIPTKIESGYVSYTVEGSLTRYKKIWGIPSRMDPTTWSQMLKWQGDAYFAMRPTQVWDHRAWHYDTNGTSKFGGVALSQPHQTFSISDKAGELMMQMTQAQEAHDRYVQAHMRYVRESSKQLLTMLPALISRAPPPPTDGKMVAELESIGDGYEQADNQEAIEFPEEEQLFHYPTAEQYLTGSLD